MTLPRMLLIAVALLVPLVAITLILAELIAPVIDSRSALAQSLAFVGYALTGLYGGFFLGGYDPAQFSALQKPERREFLRKFWIAVAILLVPLLGLNLFLARDRGAFLQWELRVLAVLLVAGCAGFALKRLVDSWQTRA